MVSLHYNGWDGILATEMVRNRDLLYATGPWQNLQTTSFLSYLKIDCWPPPYRRPQIYAPKLGL